MYAENQQQLMAQGDAFKLLAACFYEPDRDMLRAQHLCENLASVLAEAAPAAVPFAEQMAAALEGLNQERLLVDYAALFVGPFELPAAPYGSVFLERLRRTMGDSTMAVQRLYQEAGLSVDVAEPPDHIAIELEFMYYLCLQEAEAKNTGDSAKEEHFRSLQAKFFNDWLYPWMAPFCEAIRTATANQFYHGLADCLENLTAVCRLRYKQ